MLVIGDVHGKINSYLNLIKKYPKTVQIGDFGFTIEHKWHLQNVNSSNHKVLFGNHDDYKFLNREHSLGNFGIYEGMFFVRGADSIDKNLRVLGRDWFKEEELTYPQMNTCITAFESFGGKVSFGDSILNFRNKLT